MKTPPKRKALPGRKGVASVEDVPKNEKGGVLVREEDISSAFKFLARGDSTKITSKRLRERMMLIGRDYSLHEIRLLFGGKDTMTRQQLNDFLLENEVTGFDPIAHAFLTFDASGNGFISESIIRNVYRNLGYGDLSKEEYQILIETADLDKDGKIGLDDFRALLHSSHQKEESPGENKMPDL